MLFSAHSLDNGCVQVSSLGCIHSISSRRKKSTHPCSRNKSLAASLFFSYVICTEDQSLWKNKKSPVNRFLSRILRYQIFYGKKCRQPIGVGKLCGIDSSLQNSASLCFLFRMTALQNRKQEKGRADALFCSS